MKFQLEYLICPYCPFMFLLVRIILQWSLWIWSRNWFRVARWMISTCQVSDRWSPSTIRSELDTCTGVKCQWSAIFTSSRRLTEAAFIYLRWCKARAFSKATWHNFRLRLILMRQTHQPTNKFVLPSTVASMLALEISPQVEKGKPQGNIKPFLSLIHIWRCRRRG